MGWNPFKGNPFKRVGGFLEDSNEQLGNWMMQKGWQTDAKEYDVKEAQPIARAAAAAKQAEFEASTRAGLERLALKRRKGFQVSMIVNPTMGSGSKLGS
jgi:hypothetical protein